MKRIEISPQRFLNMYLFVNCKNCEEFKKKVLSKKFRSLSLIDTRLVLDGSHVVLAANKACYSIRMKTRDIHTELLFDLGISRNIGTCLNTFGVKDDNTTMIVCGFDMTEEEDKLLRLEVKGEVSEFSKIAEIRNIERIKQIYEIDNNINDIQDIRKMVVSKIAIRDI